MYDIYGASISQTTANCYVVSHPGQYKFPLVFGNALKDGTTNSVAYTKNSGSYSVNFVDYKGTVISSPYIETVSGEANSAQLSIADTDGVFTDISLTSGTNCRYVQFTVASVPTTGANGIISILNSSGVIMWSWHIWVWEHDLTPVQLTNNTNVKYNILPVNLATKMDDGTVYGTGTTGYKNWFYQWGRPTPLLCTEAYNSSTDHVSYGALNYIKKSLASNYYTGIRNPTTFYYSGSGYYNWFNVESCYNLWDAACTTTGASDNDVVKTVYDPCPIGFKVPNVRTFSYFSTSNVVGSFSNGWKFKRMRGDTVGVFFPASGERERSNGSATRIATNGLYYTSSIASKDRIYPMNFHSGAVYAGNTYDTRDYGYSIRPVQE